MAGTSALPAPRTDRLALWTMHDLFWLLYLYPFRFITARIPRALLYELGKLVEPFVQLGLRKRRNSVMRSMLSAQCPGITPETAPGIARQFLSNAVFRGLDDLIISRPSCERMLRCTEVQGLDHLEEAKSAGKGVVLLTAHFSANRIAKKYLAAIGYPILVVRGIQLWLDSGRLAQRILDAPYREFEQGLISEVVHPRDPECTLKILQRLRSGGLVNLQFDARAVGMPANGRLFGLPRAMRAGVFDIARLSGCAVLPMLCLGRSTGFRILFGPKMEMVNADTRDEFVAANLPLFVATIEKQIADHPDEWVLWENL